MSPRVRESQSRSSSSSSYMAIANIDNINKQTRYIIYQQQRHQHFANKGASFSPRTSLSFSFSLFVFSSFIEQHHHVISHTFRASHTYTHIYIYIYTSHAGAPHYFLLTHGLRRQRDRLERAIIRDHNVSARRDSILCTGMRSTCVGDGGTWITHNTC